MSRRSDSEPPAVSDTDDAQRDIVGRIRAQRDIVGRIRRAARTAGVDPIIALAFADVESGLRNVVGDKHRPTPRLHAYGPFQVTPKWWMDQLPEELWGRLEYNIPAGIRAVQWALRVGKDDLNRARLVYVRGAKQADARDDTRRRILYRWHRTLDKWGLGAGFDDDVS